MTGGVGFFDRLRMSGEKARLPRPSSTGRTRDDNRMREDEVLRSNN